MFTRLLTAVALLTLAACSGSYSSPFDSYHYVDANTIAPESIGKPLADNSKAKKKEIATIIAMQKKPSKKDLELASHEHTHLDSELLATVANPKLTRDNAPKTFTLLDNVKSDCMSNVEKAKSFWHTARPYLADKRVKALVENPNTNGSFPSGHAACGKVLADVLSDVTPRQHKALEARAAAIGQHRILLGLHYPEDIAAGNKLASLFYAKLKQTGSFQKDLNATKAEVVIVDAQQADVKAKPATKHHAKKHHKADAKPDAAK